jgi:uncharacterized protein
MANEDKAFQGCSKGGQNSGGTFRNNPQRAAKAGRKGGQEPGGNFKKDPTGPPWPARRAAKVRTADGADLSGQAARGEWPLRPSPVPPLQKERGWRAGRVMRHP